MIKYNLKKTKTTDAETFDHLITVLMIILGDARLNNKIFNIPSNKKEITEINKAKKYLKNYIKELIKQNK